MTNISSLRLDSEILKSLADLPLAAGDLLYAEGADSLVRLPKGAAGQVLTMNGGATAPEWATGATVLEGTFTPSISFGDAAVGMTYSNQYGNYKKIGSLVVAQGRVTLSAKGSSTGVARLEGLPFAGIGGALSNTFPLAVYCAAMTGLTGKVSASITGTNEAILYQSAATGDALVTDANFTVTTDVRFSAVYFTSA